MIASKLFAKGQTTIPRLVQRALEVQPGDKIQSFIADDGRGTLTPKMLSINHFPRLISPPRKTVTLGGIEQALAAGRDDS